MVVYTIKENDWWNRENNRIMAVCSSIDIVKKQLRNLKSLWPAIENWEIEKHELDDIGPGQKIDENGNKLY